MKEPRTQVGHGTELARGVALALVIALAVGAPSVGAQQQGGQALQGGGQGAGSGGTSGGIASPQGAGAGGTTAGRSAGPGSPAGASTGPGPVNQNRFGGRPANPIPPDVPPPGDDTPTTVVDTGNSIAISALGDGGTAGENYVMGRGGRCEDYELGRMRDEERVAGTNLERLAAAELFLAPDFRSGGPRTPTYILANYQQELEQSAPSLELAGTYLGLIATRRITPTIVEQVNNLLCLASAEPQAERIAQAAETQRLMVR